MANNTNKDATRARNAANVHAPAPVKKREHVAPTLNPSDTDTRARYTLVMSARAGMPTSVKMPKEYAYTIAADNKADALALARELVRAATLRACGELEPSIARSFADEMWRCVKCAKQSYVKSAPATPGKNARKRAARATSPDTSAPAPAPVRTNKGNGRKAANK